MNTNIKPERSIVLPMRGDQILLGLKKQEHAKSFGVGKWNGFGGKLEPGETVEQAAFRELKEECGLTANSLEQVAVLNYLDDYGMICHVFVTEDFEGEPVETGEMTPKWFSKNDLPWGQMWDDDIFWLPAVLRGKKLRADFHFAAKSDELGVEDNPTTRVEVDIVDEL